MERDEWLRIGVDHGFCTPEMCIAHVIPYTDDEAERFELGLDPCIAGVRLL